MSDRVSVAARRLSEAFRTGRPIADLPAVEAPQTRADAFAIQDATFDFLGRKVGAWKVGGSPGTEPTASPIATSSIYSSGQVFSSTEHRNFGVEAEIAFRLGQDVPQRQVDYSADDIRASVSDMIVTIEIVESRLLKWPETDPLWTLMDFQANDALVLGAEMPVPELLDFSTQHVRLLFDDNVVFEDTGTFAGGDPFILMAWLANHGSGRTGSLAGRGLKAGDVITTGSWNGVHFAKAGTVVRVAFTGLGEAGMQFA